MERLSRIVRGISLHIQEKKSKVVCVTVVLLFYFFT